MSTNGDVIPIKSSVSYWEGAERAALAALNYARRMLGKTAVVLCEEPDDRDSA